MGIRAWANSAMATLEQSRSVGSIGIAVAFVPPFMVRAFAFGVTFQLVKN